MLLCCAGWTTPKPVKGEKLASLELDAEKAMILLQRRSCYILILFCDMLKPSARELTKLWQALEDKDIQDRLGEVDSCCMTGQATLLTVWSSMIQDLIAVGNIDVAGVLKDCQVTPVTSTAKKTMKASTSSSSLLPDKTEEDDAEKTRSLFSVARLFSFGSGERAPPADFLASLRLTIQDKLLRQARVLEKNIRDKLHVQVSLVAVDAKGRAKHNSELVLKIDDPQCMVEHSANSETKMFKVEKTMQLMFFGEV